MKKISRAAIQHVEAELTLYSETKSRLRKAREVIRGDAISVTAHWSDMPGGGGGPGDPTARAAFTVLDHRAIQHDQAVVDAVDSVLRLCTDEQMEFIRLRYWDNPQRLKMAGIALELNVGERTLYRWRDGICREISMRMGWR